MFEKLEELNVEVKDTIPQTVAFISKMSFSMHRLNSAIAPLKNKISQDDYNVLICGLLETSFYPEIEFTETSLPNNVNFQHPHLQQCSVSNEELSNAYSTITEDCNLETFLREHYEKKLIISKNNGKFVVSSTNRNIRQLSHSEVEENIYLCDIASYPFANIVNPDYLLSPNRLQPYSRDRINILRGIAHSTNYVLEKNNFNKMDNFAKAKFFSEIIVPSISANNSTKDKATFQKQFLVFLIANSLYNPELIEKVFNNEVQSHIQTKIARNKYENTVRDFGLISYLNSTQYKLNNDFENLVEYSFNGAEFSPNIQLGSYLDASFKFDKITNLVDTFLYSGNKIHPLLEEACEYLSSFRTNLNDKNYVFIFDTHIKHLSIDKENPLESFFSSLSFIAPFIQKQPYLAENALYCGCLDLLSELNSEQTNKSLLNQFIVYAYTIVSVDVVDMDDQPSKLEAFRDWIVNSFENISETSGKYKFLEFINTNIITPDLDPNEQISIEDMPKFLFSKILKQRKIFPEFDFSILENLYAELFQKILEAEIPTNNTSTKTIKF